jgi:hypothetical protein
MVSTWTVCGLPWVTHGQKDGVERVALVSVVLSVWPCRGKAVIESRPSMLFNIHQLCRDPGPENIILEVTFITL